MKIKPELLSEYNNYVETNGQDEYSKACVEAGEAVMKLLDEGKTCEEAEKGLHGKELTGFMAGATAMAVAHFHERGEEFNKFWNKSVGGTGEEKGTINPAILTINE